MYLLLPWEPENSQASGEASSPSERTASSKLHEISPYFFVYAIFAFLLLNPMTRFYPNPVQIRIKKQFFFVACGGQWW